MEIEYLYASALLIKNNNNNILVDGLIKDNNIIRNMPEKTERHIINRESDFAYVNYLLFTHKHDDHYDFEKVDLYKKRFPDINIIDPDSCHKKEVAIFEYDEFDITFYKSDHIDNNVFNIDHYSICVKTKDSCTFICGDADLRGEWFKKATADLSIDTIFVNPIHISSTPMRNALKFVDAQKLYVYHIPPKDNDQFGYRIMAERAAKNIDFADYYLCL